VRYEECRDVEEVGCVDEEEKVERWKEGLLL
jgi:hypothetical protein